MLENYDYILSLDIETYSPEDLPKCGVYKYAAHPEARILWLACELTDIKTGKRNPVTKFDLMKHTFPEAVIKLIKDPRVAKFAWNANFERTFLSARLGFTVGPEHWFCTMVLAARAGYPMSLDVAAKAMGVENQKSAVGKALINYFCKPCAPTKANGGRTRNLPGDAPQKWEEFGEYCAQDVRAESDIRDRLLKIPVSEFETKLWHLDQQINDHGVRVDVPFIQNAIRIHEAYVDDLKIEAAGITGLDNPNSRDQLIAWLRENELEVDTLRKADVAKLIKEVQQGNVKRMLEIRSEVNKTSVKKYSAMVNCVGTDDRIRGMAQFYGAKTGRWCLTGDHEVYTRKGWVRLDCWQGGTITCYNPETDKLSFMGCSANKFDYEGNLFEIKNDYYDQLSTGEHKMPLYRFGEGRVEECTVQQLWYEALQFWQGEGPKSDSSVCKLLLRPGRVYDLHPKDINDNRKFSGYVYCPTTPTGYFWVRRNGKQWVTGNSGRLVQLQNLVQNHFLIDHKQGLDDLDVARSVVADGDSVSLEMLYGNVPDTLSQLIRTAIVPTPGHRFVISDYSAIEARVLAWLAGEQWRLDLFEEGVRDIYIESIARALGLDYFSIDKKTPEGHRLRQLGKILELASGFQGGLGAYIRFGALEKGLTEEDIQAMVTAWRIANLNIFTFWYAIENAAKEAILNPGSRVSVIQQYPVFVDWWHPGFPVKHFERQNHLINFKKIGRTLYMFLPSGRFLAYVNARIEDRSIKFEGMNQVTKRWCTQETYGGRLVENCLGFQTEVLTFNGWKQITEVTISDKLWDGENWVSHAGFVYKGNQNTICIDGVYLTPEHKILTANGWKEALQVQGLDRAAFELPYRDQIRRKQRVKIALVSQVRLWQRVSDSFFGLRKRKTKVVRVYESAVNRQRTSYAPVIETPDVLGMALHESSVFESQVPRLAQLRRSRHNRLRPLVRTVRKLLGRYVSNLCSRAYARSQRQQRELYTGKLSMGINEKASQQHEVKHCNSDTLGSNDSRRSRRFVGNQSNDYILSNSQRMPGRSFIRQTGRYEPVCDLINSGPLHRFTVRGKNGIPFIVHNCTQAVARDCLAEAMVNLDKAGYPIVMTVHDEVVLEVPFGKGSADEISSIMGIVPAWATGLPLKAESFETMYYKKE